MMTTSALWRGPLLFGHRGAPATGAPENTFASFQRALDDGATALETDAHSTRDGHIVISHDPNVRHLVITSATLADLRAVDLGNGERVPLLRDVLDHFQDMPINIDIKQRDPMMESSIVNVVGKDAPRVLLTSFHADVVGRVRALGYRGPTGLSRDELVRLIVTPRLLVKLARIRGLRAQVPRARGRVRFDTRAFIDKCHALGVAVDYWVINDAMEARTLLDLGADGIMTDAPGIIRPAFARP